MTRLKGIRKSHLKVSLPQRCKGLSFPKGWECFPTYPILNLPAGVLIMSKHLCTGLFALCFSSLFAQSLPFDFESATAGMVGYDNATFTIVSNPSAMGNSSSQVAKIVKVTAGDLWAGGKITNVSSLNFSSAATSVLSMKVYTTEPAGTVIKVKLESPYTSEVDAVTTVSGMLETLEFDFGIPAPTGSADLVIMPQPFTSGGGKTFYFDDIQQVSAPIAPLRPNLPITFEAGTIADHFFCFESATMLVVANPDVSALNQSSLVGKLVRYLGGPYGGTVIEFSNTLDFVNHPVITMKVWTSAPIGTYVTLKAEKPFWGEERSVQTTKTGEWELLSFDFTNAPTDLTKLAFLFDFTAGSTNVGNGSASSTFYFDEVKFANVGLSMDEPSSEIAFLASPNPTAGTWVIQPQDEAPYHLALVDTQGRCVLKREGSGRMEVNATEWPSGLYHAHIRSNTNAQILKLVKL